MARRRQAVPRSGSDALLVWGTALTIATAVVWFLHECAHGVGYKINGASVSTGFNMVGSHGKAPGDPGFRAAVPVTGTPSLGTVLGPATNWVVAGAATAAFLRWPRGRRGLVFAATAVGAALPRVLSLASFLLPAIAGRVVYQDEIEWGARHVHAFAFPTTLQAFQAELRAHPREFLSTPGVYEWPGVSLVLCCAALTIVYLRMRQFRTATFGKRWPLALAAPFAAWAVVGAAFAALDQVVRIDW